MLRRHWTSLVAVSLAMGFGAVQQAAAWDRDNIIPLMLTGRLAELTAQGPGRLAKLSARQQLNDQVCIAMADGRISRFERSMLLASARQVLTPEEFVVFRQSIDQSTPAMIAANRRAAYGTQEIAQDTPSPATPDAPTPPRFASSRKGSVDIVLTEHVAAEDEAR
jgi:hypothetical protein